MFENILNFFKKTINKNKSIGNNSKDTAKERLHLVLMQDRANVSADFLELMKQEIIEVIKKYIEVDESAIDVRLTNKENEDGTNGAPALYANIPILNIKNENKKFNGEQKVENVERKEEVNKESKIEKIEDNSKQNKIEEEEKVNKKNKTDKVEKKQKMDKKENTKNETKKQKEQKEEVEEVIIDNSKEQQEKETIEEENNNDSKEQ